MIRSRTASENSVGDAEANARVYGCAGSVRMLSVEPYS